MSYRNTPMSAEAWQRFLWDVAKESLPEYSLLMINGNNADVDVGTETVWDEGGVYAWIAAATTVSIASASTNDTIAGSGARTVKITYLTDAYVETEVTKTLTGQTEVTIASDVFRINKIEVLTVGATGYNEGIIYCGTGTFTTGKPANVFAIMAIGKNVNTSMIYTVPAGKTAWIFKIATGIAASVAGAVNLELIHKEDSGLCHCELNPCCLGGALLPFIEIAEKSDIQIDATSAVANSSVKTTMFILLETNPT